MPGIFRWTVHAARLVDEESVHRPMESSLFAMHAKSHRTYFFIEAASLCFDKSAILRCIGMWNENFNSGIYIKYLTTLFWVYTVMCTQITYDVTKDAMNQAKHGVSLAAAASFDSTSAVTWADTRIDYHEERMHGLGLIGSRVYAVVYVMRDESRRVISLR